MYILKLLKQNKVKYNILIMKQITIFVLIKNVFLNTVRSGKYICFLMMHVFFLYF